MEKRFLKHKYFQILSIRKYLAFLENIRKTCSIIDEDSEIINFNNYCNYYYGYSGSYLTNKCMITFLEEIPDSEEEIEYLKEVDSLSGFTKFYDMLELKMFNKMTKMRFDYSLLPHTTKMKYYRYLFHFLDNRNEINIYNLNNYINTYDNIRNHKYYQKLYLRDMYFDYEAFLDRIHTEMDEGEKENIYQRIFFNSRTEEEILIKKKINLKRLI
jgi:hypothetical protein